MLAITKTNAYEVCIIKKDGKCIDSNDCTGSNHEFILDIEGNKCSNDCNSENNFCNVSCDKSIYIEINDSCVLCKDYYPDKPYKLIIGSYCFSEEDIPEGSEIYNSSLFLLRCKDGYVFEDETCILNTTNKSTSFPTTITKTIMTNNSTTITINDIITSMPKSVETPSIVENENEIFCSVNEVINDTCTEGKMNLSDLDTIKNYLKSRGKGDEDSTIKTLKTRNVIIQFGSLYEQDTNNKEVSNIDLGECEQELRTVYNISDNISLIAYKVDIKNSDSTATYVQYEVYDPITNNQLNMSICNEMKITIDTPVDIGNKIEELYNSLSDSGYNLFNSEDSFYQDICTTYTTENETDMILSDRKKDIYSLSEDVSLCQIGCTLKSYNSETKKAKCNCDIEDTSSSIKDLDIDSLFNKDEIKQSFYDTLSNSNFRVLKCYKLVFSYKILKNICEIFMSIITILFLGFNSFSYIIYEQKIKSYILNVINVNEGNSICNNQKKLKSKERSKSLNNIRQINSSINKNNSSVSKNKKKKKRKTVSGIRYPPKKIKKNSKHVLIISESMSKNKLNNNMNSKSINNETSNKNKNKISVNENFVKKLVIEEKNLFENNEENIKIENLNDQEINDLKYEIAINTDKRTYFEYYWSLLKKKQLILFTFCPNNDYNIYTIKVSLFLLSFGLYFTINGFFFTDDTMHKLYVNQGTYNILLQLPQILFSTVISAVINAILKMLSLTEKNIISLKKEKEKVIDKIKSTQKCLKIKFLIYFALSVLFMLFFWYFASCFCAVYKNTQKVLIKDTLFSFALSMVYPFGLNLLPGIFRIPALRAQKKDKGYMYKISQYIALV